MIDKSFWKNKRVLITGHTGFKGGWLSIWLASLGVNLKGIALLPSSEVSLFSEAKIDTLFDCDFVDIRDYDALLASMQRFKPEIVLHLAAQPLVRKSYISPRETYSTNVMGTLNVFEAVREIGDVKVLINVTSDKCYENKEWVWGYREQDPMGGYDPYSSSKGCSELLTSSYRQSFFHPLEYDKHGVALASVRAGNVIGGGDWAEDRLVPDTLKAFQNNQVVNIRNPYSMRPWQHVLEPLSGYLKLAEQLYQQGGKFAEAWNFGPISNNELCVQDIVSYLANLWGTDAKWSVDQNIQPHEANFLKLDCSKSKTLLQWTPQWEINEVLMRIVHWHKAWMSGENMLDYCLSEINDYIKTGY